ncbi:shikimate kinase [Bowdeniella nasicola]|nr:shikimate kinase [Bowdeniella nasicola]
MTEPRLIALIGAPGSGKTTIAAALAEEIGVSAIDGDEFVERHSGHSPADLAVDLEPADAHAAIRAALVALGESITEPTVVAMPSSVIELDNPDELLAPYTVVFLDVDLATSFPRTGLAAPRPVGFVLPRSLWHEMLVARRPQYEQLADCIIDVSGAIIQAIVEQILTKTADTLK